ncbi:MAG: 2-hydroxyhepta-2,4-diene-1,7-dioate isomerase [Opitutales bacterium]|nr:2-hydroxyhepta-2,4-diene-1,7-dioate isomerase [Opitutales bacterium]MBT6770301.1 2-hydroxyhepta-2,4-diene-1,7-dioate isomerase [Opitutales bacterium]
MTICIYRTASGVVVSRDDEFGFWEVDWDQLFKGDTLRSELKEYNLVPDARARSAVENELLPPVGSQEIWAAGVTYYSSRLARMEESKTAGGSDFYASVYNADRPELFFKSAAHRVKGDGQAVRIREDSSWDVPEPELTLALSTNGKIIGYTVGNDMSSRSIEGENPLYLPQAKTYEGAAGLGPCLYVLDTELPASTKISLKIYRSDALVFEGETELSAMKRKPEELAGYLFRELSFPQGCYLMTGTGIVPGNDFTLESGDCIEIDIEGLGTLKQVVA